MDPLIVLAILLCMLFILLALRMPVAITLITLSLLGIAIIRSPLAAFATLAGIPYDFSAHWSLSAIPMFLLMGALSHRGGLTSSIFKAAKIWLGKTTGGLAISTNVATAAFSAASGSSLAATAAMARLAGPEMLAAGYAPSLASSVIAAAGTVGALIPPSILLIIYGWYAEQPIGELLMAGFLPGLLTAVVYCLVIYLRCRISPDIAPPCHDEVTPSQKLKVLMKIWPLPLLIFSIMGSIYTGIATATEAAALGCIIALLVIIFRGDFSIRVILSSLSDSLKSTAAIFFIAIGAALFANLIAISGLPNQVGEFINEISLTPTMLMLIFVFTYLLLGIFLDPIGIMLITLPIFLPAFNALNMNLIWIGIVLVKLIEIGLITPPVGLNVFIVKDAFGDSVAIGDIFRGLIWFIVAEIFIVGILILFPKITLFLPQLMSS
ncbi:TRAP transporter large permease [Alcaligenes sp. 13f]|uniref:TRAP transporter large permease n=1 Tax=Alcaligenes sp. 13f TaxID=2841924 RepID=UPI001CF61C22|nr:TRAP transporter large permease [Alcaligenes sp. 13f]MCB4321559.1 TRAP transporter large permease [Alcaligenes sp. 13f]